MIRTCINMWGTPEWSSLRHPDPRGCGHHTVHHCVSAHVGGCCCRVDTPGHSTDYAHGRHTVHRCVSVHGCAVRCWYFYHADLRVIDMLRHQSRDCGCRVHRCANGHGLPRHRRASPHARGCDWCSGHSHDCCHY
jgi:hypothetical protein